MPKAIWNDTVVAESDDTILVDGNHYFPPDAIVREHFRESTYTTRCRWKGTARYFTLEVGGQRNESGAWTYPKTKAAAKAIEGYVAFWRGVEIVE